MNHATASNEILALWAHHTGRQDVDVEFFVIVNDGVSSVVAALCPAAELRLSAQNVNELTFAFVSPLCACKRLALARIFCRIRLPAYPRQHA